MRNRLGDNGLSHQQCPIVERKANSSIEEENRNWFQTLRIMLIHRQQTQHNAVPVKLIIQEHEAQSFNRASILYVTIY